MKWAEAEQHLQQQLAPLYDTGEAAAIANLVFCELAGMDRLKRKSVGNNLLPAELQQQLQRLLERLSYGEPVQYVIGKAAFRKLDLNVDERVLIPRPETEELVEWVLQDLKRLAPGIFMQNTNKADKTDEVKILDVGTGSGCIALSLKNEAPLAEVWACDVSDDALAVARQNGAVLNIRVDFLAVDFLNAAEQESLPAVDVLISNPPYIPKSEAASLHQNVTAHEPHHALFVPDENALIFYNALLQFANHKLHPHGKIYVETHEEKAHEVANLFSYSAYQTEIRKDMQGKDRMVKAWR